jgi:hypothetical protein
MIWMIGDSVFGAQRGAISFSPETLLALGVSHVNELITRKHCKT